MGTTRFPNGVTNAGSETALGDYIAMDPTRVHTFFDDFNDYNSADWTITTTEAGSGDATEALTTDGLGVLLITNDNGAADEDWFQRKNTVFSLEAAKQAWFKIRFKVSDATQSNIAVGLQVIDTSPLAVTDGIWFRKDDGDAYIDFICQKDDSTGKNTASAIGTLADNTWTTLGWYYDGQGEVTAFINDVKMKTISASSTYFPDTILAVSFGIKNGEAVAKTMSVDYVFAAKER